jgi:peptidoglycan/LPS O-acetylase OafA/YrhL
VGECSYGIYLAHSLAIQIALQAMSDSKLAHPVAIFASVLGVGLGVGLLAGAADLALYRRLKRWADRRTRPMAPALAEPAP